MATKPAGVVSWVRLPPAARRTIDRIAAQRGDHVSTVIRALVLTALSGVRTPRAFATIGQPATSDTTERS